MAEFTCFVVKASGVSQRVFVDLDEADDWAVKQFGEDYDIDEVPVTVAKSTHVERASRGVPGRAMWFSSESFETLIEMVIRGHRLITRFPPDKTFKIRFVGYDGTTSRILFHVETDAVPDGVDLGVVFTQVGPAAYVVEVPGCISREMN